MPDADGYRVSTARLRKIGIGTELLDDGASLKNVSVSRLEVRLDSATILRAEFFEGGGVQLPDLNYRLVEKIGLCPDLKQHSPGPFTQSGQGVNVSIEVWELVPAWGINGTASRAAFRASTS